MALAGRRRTTDLVDLVGDPRDHVAEDQRQEDRDAAEEPAAEHGHDDDERGGQQADPLLVREVDRRGDRGQVEADQHDHGAGDDGRQHGPHVVRAAEVHEHADRGEDQPGDQDRAGDVRRVAALRADRGHRRDERRRRAEVGRHPSLDDQQEDDRGDAGHQHGEVRVQPHDRREDERRAEHGDDVLGAEASPSAATTTARPGRTTCRSVASCRRRRASSRMQTCRRLSAASGARVADCDRAHADRRAAVKRRSLAKPDEGPVRALCERTPSDTAVTGRACARRAGPARCPDAGSRRDVNGPTIDSSLPMR